MKLSEMTAGERETLGSLVRLMVGADGSLSSAESADLQRLATDLGEADFWALVRGTEGTLFEREAVQAQARSIERPEVRHQIYGLLLGLASAGAIIGDEAQLLEWLADTWGIQPGA